MSKINLISSTNVAEMARKITKLRKELNCNISEEIDVLIEINESHTYMFLCDIHCRQALFLDRREVIPREFLKENCLIRNLYIKTDDWITIPINDELKVSTYNKSSEQEFYNFKSGHFDLKFVGKLEFLEGREDNNNTYKEVLCNIFLKRII